MNVIELREYLTQFPDDMEILYRMCSDYERLDAEDLKVVGAVDQNGYWMQEHPTMSDENKAKMKSYLLFPGN